MQYSHINRKIRILKTYNFILEINYMGRLVFIHNKFNIQKVLK